MKVAKWGNSLAVRIPANVAEAVGLKEGDEVRMHVAERGRAFEVKKEMTPHEALVAIRKYRGLMPADFKFNREEVYERGYEDE
ncbi:MAG TPA: AbrB/MazE/SpoVT family DNA-binding domain-containing protein [Caulobacteraceae bacterium]